MYVRVPKIAKKKHLVVCDRKTENKVNYSHLFTYSVQNTSLNGHSVGYTFALNNDLIFKKVDSVNMTEQPEHASWKIH